jgi:hypothetical protein
MTATTNVPERGYSVDSRREAPEVVDASAGPARAHHLQARDRSTQADQEQGRKGRASGDESGGERHLPTQRRQ